MGVYFDIVSNRRRGPLAFFAKGVLAFASWFFRGVVAVRLVLYRRGWLRSFRVDRPVICVGNLTTGGTGKTPAAAWLVETLRSFGLRPGVVSRGYGGGGGGNDEARVLEEALGPDLIHVQNPDRVAAARRAIAEGAEALVLDDGFSHLRLQRDLDILLLDALNPFGWGRMLPRGLLREPLSSLRRAGAVILTRADLAAPERLRDLEDVVRCKGFVGPIAHAVHRPKALVPLRESGESLDPGRLQGRAISAFCGLGNPQGFQRTLEHLGATLAGSGLLALRDHAAYDRQEIEAAVLPWLARAKESGAELAVCTTKDAVKLRRMDWMDTAALPVYELRIELEVTRGAEELRALLREVVDG